MKQGRLFPVPSRAPKYHGSYENRAANGQVAGISFEQCLLRAIAARSRLRLERLVSDCEYRAAEFTRMGFTALAESWDHSRARAMSALKEVSR